MPLDTNAVAVLAAPGGSYILLAAVRSTCAVVLSVYCAAPCGCDSGLPTTSTLHATPHVGIVLPPEMGSVCETVTRCYDRRMP